MQFGVPLEEIDRKGMFRLIPEDFKNVGSAYVGFAFSSKNGILGSD